MNTNHLLEIFDRDLKKLKEEILLYKSDADLWKLSPGIANSTGTLALHIAGNIHHFIGAVLGKSGYVRQREKEFADRNVSRDILVKGLDDSIVIVNKILPMITDAQLEQDYPIEFMGKRKTASVLIILVSHLGYHLGQVNYHRRLFSV